MPQWSSLPKAAKLSPSALMSEIDSLEVLGCLVMRWTGIIQRVFENRASRARF
jgi:hypothetical protein